MTVQPPIGQASVLDKVNAILDRVRDDILNARYPIVLHTHASDKKSMFDVDRKLMVPRKNKRQRVTSLSFPSDDVKKNLKFAVYIRLLGLIKDNLEEDNLSTKRDLYYQDVELFENQKVVDSTINSIAAYMEVERLELNIAASPKGLVYGDLIIFTNSGRTVEISRNNGPSTIPLMLDEPLIRISEGFDAKCILVVEKEAVFRELSESLPNVILLTGKGFPDVCSRKLLKLLSQCYPNLPVYGLVDSDPHGIQILSTYKYGSAKMAHESASLAVERIQFLGVSILEYNYGWIQYSTRDRVLAMSMLKKKWMQMADTALWRREIQLGLFLGKKAEMNIVASSDENLRISQYVKEKLRNLIQFF